MAAQSEKQKFMKAVTVLIDTREQKNSHITELFDKWGVAYEQKKLDFGDYSFVVAGRDFSHCLVIERKADVMELYGNVREHKTDRNGRWLEVGERIQKELDSANRNGCQLVLMLENCDSADTLKAWKVPEWQQNACPDLKTVEVGKVVYCDIKSWMCSNKYDFKLEYVSDKHNTAARMIEEFYYWYRNYKGSVSARK